MNNEAKCVEIKNKICNFLKEGIFRKDASVLAGISEATFYRWVKEDESFESRVEASILEYKRTLIKNVTACAEKDGRLALEVLKRRFPSEWGDNAYTLTTQEMNNERKGVVAILEAVYSQEEAPIRAESIPSDLSLIS